MAGPFRVGGWRVDPSLRTVAGSNGEIHLEPKQMQVLVHLAEHAGQVVTREHLLQTVWADTFVGDEVLARAISELRRALRDDPKSPQFIQTIPKGGYRLIAPVTFDPPRDTRTEAEGQPQPPAVNRSGTGRYWVAGALLAAIGVTSIAAWRFHATSAAKPLGTMRTVPFTTFPGVEDAPAFSPDGSRLAFNWIEKEGDDPHVFIRLPGDDPPQQLTRGPGGEVYPSWAPDGRSIAFTRVSNGEASIRLMPALGGAERTISTTWRGAPPWCWPRPKWSPDGRRLVFAAPHGNTCQVRILSLDTFESRPVTAPTTPVFDSVPIFSPDGGRIAFVRFRTFKVADVYAVPVKGGEPTQLTHDDALIEGQVAWASDGKSIVYASDRAGATALWRVGIDGGEPQRVAPGGDAAADPTIDGPSRRLAYVRQYGDSELYEVSLDRPGEAPKALAASRRDESSPDFSPDGRKLVFDSNRSGPTADLWTSESDGTNPVRLTFVDRGKASSPRWSPDGQWIAFDSSAHGSFDIFVVRSNGGQPRRLTNETSTDAIPTWSRDGRAIYFASDRTGTEQIWRMPAGGGAATQITRGGGFGGLESADGRYLYYTKGERVSGIWRVPIGGGTEEPVIPDAPVIGYSRCWALSDRGIYFLDTRNHPLPSLGLFDFATGRTAMIATLPKSAETWGPNLTVSPDRRRLIVVLLEGLGSDVMLVENFQ